jgi:hypothetical protein
MKPLRVRFVAAMRRRSEGGSCRSFFDARAARWSSSETVTGLTSTKRRGNLDGFLYDRALNARSLGKAKVGV